MRIFPVQPAGSVRKSTFERPFIFPTLKVAAYLLVIGTVHCLECAAHDDPICLNIGMAQQRVADCAADLIRFLGVTLLEQESSTHVT